MARYIARVVDDSVPGPLAFERLKAVTDVCIAVAREFFDLVAEHAGLAASIEHRDVMATIQRMVDLVRPEKSGTAEKEDVELFVRGRDRRAGSGGRRAQDSCTCANKLSACRHESVLSCFF
jgi:hypothetical protein